MNLKSGKIFDFFIIISESGEQIVLKLYSWNK